MTLATPTHIVPATAARQRLRAELARGRVVGTFVKLPAPEVIDIVAAAGFGFAIIDLEHSQLADADALRLARHAAAIGLPALVRLPECDSGLVNRCLEAGAAGVQLSSVRSVASVRALVESTRYAPAGRRSVSLAHPMGGYGRLPLRDLVAQPHPLLVGQIEHAEADDPLPDILAAGLDVAFLGLTDLTVDVAFDDQRLQARVDELERASNAADVALGAYAPDLAAAPASARYVAVSSDLALLAAAAGEVARGA
jgi:4-hydroxy-2-oxoheptanedioate aldolase